MPKHHETRTVQSFEAIWDKETGAQIGNMVTEAELIWDNSDGEYGWKIRYIKQPRRFVLLDQGQDNRDPREDDPAIQGSQDGHT